MLKRIEERNREVWRDHSTMLEDITHVLGGIGIGLLLFPLLEKKKTKPVASALVLISTALHFYADTFKPSTTRSRARGRSRTNRSRIAQLLNR